jgi:hypothetical protein
MSSTTQRRPRTRPLRDFANRSPVHAFGVWLLKSALILTLGAIFILVIINIAVPMMSDGFLRVIQNR